MNCVRTKNTGNGGCNRGMVTQSACHRKAVVMRELGTGKVIRLCKQCDDRFGHVVGKVFKIDHDPLTLSGD